MRGLVRWALVGVIVCGVLAGGAISSQAFTLIDLQPKVSVSPTSGLPMDTFRIRGRLPLGMACPPGFPTSPFLFRFYWFKVASSRILLWSKSTKSCVSGSVDTGNSPALSPPTRLNNPGTYVIQVNIFDPATNKPLIPKYSNTTTYRVLTPKPSPAPTPVVPTPCGQVGTPTCPSPTPSQCAVGTTGMVPPAAGDLDAAVMAALVLFGTLPIGGLVIVISPGGWNHRRFNQLAALIGLTLVILTASGCTAIVGQNGPSPSQSEPSPSPSPSPSPTC